MVTLREDTAQGLQEEAEKLLRELGFSDSECSIYFSLLQKPSGEAIEQLLSQSNMSTDQAERAIKNLVDKGVVRIASNKLEASEPKQFIGRVQDLKRLEVTRSLESLTETSSRLLSILEPYYWETRLGIKPEEILEPLPTLEDMELRTVRVLGDATRQVLISAESFGWFSKIREEAARAIERGVKFRVLMSVKTVEATQKAHDAKAMAMEVRTHREDWYPVRGTLGDTRELVFLIWATPEKGSHRPKYFRPHYSRNEGMIRVFSDAFEKRWIEARNV